MNRENKVSVKVSKDNIADVDSLIAFLSKQIIEQKITPAPLKESKIKEKAS